MPTCNTVMCKYNLNNSSDVKKWLLKNHPDKGGKISPDEFNKVIECYQYELNDGEKGLFCGSSQGTKRPKLTPKVYRRRVFSCMRKTANFSKINMYHKFDKNVFDPTKLNKELVETSPKITQLLNNIKKLDELDMKNHGKNFKHFIFSDVKDGGYGAKVLASAFMANGFFNVVKARKVPKQQRMKLYIDLNHSGKNNFALLCSNAIYGGATFNEKLKKEILGQYNKRPDNINGKNIRFIILDSGFKEGIDLFDVKYVHIFEPSMTIADLKQTVGRATRTCGQKGLEFQPNIGWPLYVYNYYLTVSELTQDSMYFSKDLISNIKDNNQHLSDKEDLLLFKDVEKFNDATMLFSEFDKAMTNLSEQLFKLAPLLSVDYGLTQNLHDVDDLNSEFMEKDFYLMGGGSGAVGGASQKNPMKNVKKNTKFYNIDLIKCDGNCGKKNTKDVPVSLDFMKKVYKKYNYPTGLIPKSQQREFFCNYMRDSEKFCRALNYEWSLRYAYIPETIEKNKTAKKIGSKLDDLDLELGEEPEDDTDKDYKILEYAGKKTATHTKSKTANYKKIVPSTKLNFLKMRDFIKSNYNRDFKWDKLVIENKCVEKSGANPNSNVSTIEFNPTQQFIMNYFVPESPYKGMLAWHSVGTGKTCTGVAMASSSFERAGYSILWITRTTLKSDVWKNIFDQVCHTIISHELEQGLFLPEKLNKRKKILSENWLEPMSYKQFSNLLAGKNKIYDILKKRNGSQDILRKTLLIIDEAHKLYGGDLKASERPDVEIMEKLIMNSYRASGDESCRLLVMTATPITNSPLELFKLTNLFVERESEKITTNKKEFVKQYMTSENLLSESGVRNLSNKLSGYISYLNREKDPTQFAQPIMINVPVLMADIDDERIRNIIYLRENIANVGDKSKQLIFEVKQKIKSLKAEYKNIKAEYNKTKKAGKTACNKDFPTKKEKEQKKKCLKELEEELALFNEEMDNVFDELNKLEDQLRELMVQKSENKDELLELREKIKTIKKSFLQEYMLYKRCHHLTYKKSSSNKSKTQKSRLLLK